MHKAVGEDDVQGSLVLEVERAEFCSQQQSEGFRESIQVGLVSCKGSREGLETWRGKAVITESKLKSKCTQY